MSEPTEHPVTVVALGGNAIARAGDDGTVIAQYQRADEALRGVADLVASGSRVVLTHGNGPVVGAIMLRGERAAGEVPPTPLYIAGADSEGGIGLMLQMVLGNRLRAMGCERPVATVVTQVVVDIEDPSLHRPSKPIGPYYAREAAEELAAERGWAIAEEPGRGWRRTVPSPHPLRVIETPAIRALLDAGCVPIAAGGGGVPVRQREDGALEGVDVVIDKDWASAVLAVELGADRLAILMEADALYTGWGGPNPVRLNRLTPARARELLGAGEFADGSVRPKVEAASWFAETTGHPAIICASEMFSTALQTGCGTIISD